MEFKTHKIPIKKCEGSYSLSNPEISSNKKINICDYEMELEPLGRGSFAIVYKGRDCKTGEIVAIKKISLDKITKTKMHKFMLEIELAVSFEHFNVLKSYKKLQTERHLYIISEYCNEGTLCDVITALKLIKNDEEREQKTKTILVQLKDALKYLANKQILHRDIKPANILFKKEDNEIVLKLADFGFSKYFDVNFEEDETQKDFMTMTICGSPIYMAPEMIVNKKASIKSDLWSFGVVMYEMLYGFNPYNSPTSCDMLAKRMISQPIDFKENFSKECITLLKGLLQTEPENRIGWKDFFKSKWFENASKMEFDNDDKMPFDIELSDSDVDKSNYSSNVKSKQPLSPEDCVFDNTNFLMKNRKKIVPKINDKSMACSPSTYDFNEDYVFIEKDKLTNSSEFYQSYSGSYIRIVSGKSSYWPFSKSY